MALINRLIRDARDGAETLTIRPQDVRPLAEHARLSRFYDLTTEQIVAEIESGNMRLLDVPVRVARVA